MKYKIIRLFACLGFFFSSLEIFAQSGWQSLFDGKTLNGWKQLTGTAGYTVENGAIVGTTVLNSPNSFLVVIKK